MAGVVKILPYYTYEDYIQWEGRWELIEGIPHAMSPAPTPIHQIVVNTLGSLFYTALKDCRQCKVAQAIDYKIEDDTIVQPDLSILCQKITKKFIDFPPALVAEILSPSTALKDRHTKWALYQQQGVKYYLIISIETEEAEVYVLKDGAFILEMKDSSFSYTFSLEDCTANIDFGELWK